MPHIFRTVPLAKVSTDAEVEDPARVQHPEPEPRQIESFSFPAVVERSPVNVCSGTCPPSFSLLSPAPV